MDTVMDMDMDMVTVINIMVDILMLIILFTLRLWLDQEVIVDELEEWDLLDLEENKDIWE